MPLSELTLPTEIMSNATGVELAESPVARAPAPTVATSKPNMALNVLWNWGGVATEAIVGFLMAPMLINGLGDERYGLWILIGSVTGYFGILDFGLRGAVGRFVALHHAQDDQDAIASVLNTAGMALFFVGCTALALIAGVALFLPELLGVPVDRIRDARVAMLIVGVQLAVWFVLRMFDAALWAYQRFDLLNLIDIPTAILRLVVTWWLLKNGGGLLAVAWVAFFTTISSGLAKGICAFLETPGLRISLRLVNRATLRALTGYGFWNFLISVTGMARSQLSPLIVGGFLGLLLVGPFSIVMRLVVMASTILTAATGVFTPRAITFHARNQDHERQRLILEGSKLSFSLSLYFLALFVWLGKPLLSIWIRPEFAAYWPALIIIGLGEVLPMTMSVSQGVLQAMARHRPLAFLVIAESVVALGLCGACARPFGLIGISLSLAFTATVFRGFLAARQVCKVTRMSLTGFLCCTVRSPLLAVSAPAGVLHLATTLADPKDWPHLFGYTLLFTLAYGSCVALGVVGWTRCCMLPIRTRRP
jgi:O-antigen/teichoic acid export membrane protein